MKKFTFFVVCFTITLVMAACGRAGTSVLTPSDIPKEQIKDNSDVPEEYENVPIEITSLVKCEGPIAGMVSAFCGSSESADVQYTDFKDVVKERVLAELMAGKGPDILMVSYEDMVELSSKGAITELSSLLSATDREIIWDSIVEYGTAEGEFVGIVPYLTGVRTYFSKQETADYGLWNIENVFKIKKQTNASRVFSYQLGSMDTYFEFYSLVGADIRNTRYIDWDNGKSQFFDKGFSNVLEEIKEDVSQNIGNRELVKEGSVLAYYYPISDAVSLYTAISELGEDGAQIGFPSETGGKSFFYTDGILVVNRNCKDKEAVASFLSYLLSPENQLRNPDIFSVRKDAAILAISEKVTSNEDDLGASKKCQWNIGNGSLVNIPLEASVEELQTLYSDLMEEVTYPQSNDAIFDIIWDETELYFLGEKEVDDVVQAIDRRVQLLLDEQ